MLCCPRCSLLSTILFGIVTPDCGLIQVQQYCSIFLTTTNNVGSKTLNNAAPTVLNRLSVFTRVAHVAGTTDTFIFALKKIAILYVLHCVVVQNCFRFTAWAGNRPKRGQFFNNIYKFMKAEFS